MSAKIFSGAVVCLETQIIEVESDISYGLRSFEIVGLPALLRQPALLCKSVAGGQSVAGGAA
ncbi:hypothetical protein KJ616_00455 [Patescibacteria group bacterium]|nr:hypothetical protein [Patescibacteria group bacterium]